jgi:hypothetical protein
MSGSNIKLGSPPRHDAIDAGYLAGVDDASRWWPPWRPGRIIFTKPQYKPYGPVDEHSPYPKPGDEIESIMFAGVNRTNTRALAPVVKALLPHFEEEIIRWLEIGFGMGVATHEARKVAQATRHRLQATGVALTPIHPNRGWNHDVAALRQHLATRLDELRALPIWQEWMEHFLQPQNQASPAMILALAQELDIPLYDELPPEEPLFERQYIGYFPEDLSRQRAFNRLRFHLIYDSHGPFQYARVDHSGSVTRNLVNRLAPDGILAVKPARTAHQFKEYGGESIAGPGDVVFLSNVRKELGDVHDHPDDIVLFAKARSVLAQRAKAAELGPIVRSNELTQMIPALLAGT